MNQLLHITILGFFSGTVGTGIGGLIAFFIHSDSPRLMSVLLGFTSGVMLSVVTFDLLPQALELANLTVIYVGLILGTALMIFVDNRIGHSKSMEHQKDIVKSGTMMAIGIALHNFPEGLAVGSGYTAAASLGLSLAVVIALHDMPEGMAMALPLSIGGLRRSKVLLYTVLSGIPNGIGAFAGGFLGQISPDLISLCLAIAGGSMLYITCGELIPRTHELYKGRISTLGLLFGLMCGLFVATRL